MDPRLLVRNSRIKEPTWGFPSDISGLGAMACCRHLSSLFMAQESAQLLRGANARATRVHDCTTNVDVYIYKVIRHAPRSEPVRKFPKNTDACGVLQQTRTKGG